MSRLEGYSELRSKLDDLGRNAGGRIARRSLRAGAKVMQAQLRQDAPDVTGQTKAAIKVRAGKRSRTKISMMVTLGKGFFQGSTFYAGFVNWGWLTGRRGSAKRRKIEGTEWLEKSWARGKDTTVDKVREEVAAAIEAEGTNGAR
jgi:HK97 gp10 family phage protein